MDRREKLEQAVSALEAQREQLGDAVVDAGIAPLQAELSKLRSAQVHPSSFAQAESPPINTRQPKRDPVQSDRRLVTVMFADISGFTALSERMDPEAVRDLINACFSCVVPVVEKYGGEVDKFIGDEIMAVFGAPVAHEDDAVRAVRAALAMCKALDGFNAANGVNLGLHFGINTGLAVAGSLGTQNRQSYTVIGDTINLGARLENLSQRGEILVGPETYNQTAALFSYHARSPVKLKGIAGAVPVYELIGLRPNPLQVRGLEIRGISSDLVGRDKECALLRQQLEGLIQGEGSIIAISGEAGVGKSRLLAEMRAVAAQMPISWYEGHTLSFGQSISYWPFQEIIRSFAGITEEDSDSTAWARLLDSTTALFPDETAEITPYLASLLSLEVQDAFTEKVKYLSSEAMGHQIFLTSRRFFERLAEKQALVLVFEDIHWVDESSARLLEHLLPLVGRARLMICVISRPYRDTPAARLREIIAQLYAGRFTDIQLASLSRADSSDLLRNLLAMPELPAQLQEMIIAKAEGNPFFLEEIIRALIDMHVIEWNANKNEWHVTTNIDSLTIPDNIKGVIIARIDRLEKDVKRVLRMASVIGRTFFYRVLQAVAEADEQLDHHLAELQAIELIQERQRIPELEFIFKHALAQEAAYEGILLQKRRELHAQVGEAIELLFPNRLEEFCGLLAYHYARAEVWEKAQAYLFKAGDLAGEVAADAEALAHYEQAIRAYAKAFGDQWDPLQRVVLERKMGEALFRRGEHQQALTYLYRAFDHLGKPVPTGRWAIRWALLAAAMRQAAQRILLGIWPTFYSESVTPELEEEARLTYALGWIDVFAFPERLILMSMRLLNASERNGYLGGIIAGLTGVGTILEFIPIFTLAGFYLRRAMVLAEKVNDPGLAGTAHLSRAIYSFYRADWDDMLAISRPGSELFWKTGDVSRWGFPVYQMAMRAAYQGDFVQALSYCDNLIRLGQESAVPQIQSKGLATRGFALQRIGRFEEAVQSLQEAFALAQEIPDRSLVISARADLGRTYLRIGLLDEAVEAMNTSRESFIPYLGGDSYASLCNGHAELCLLNAEKWRSDPSVQADWLRQAGKACQQALKQGRTFYPGLPEAQRLRGTLAFLKGKRRAAQRWWAQSLALAADVGQAYDVAMTHFEVGRRLEDAAQLTQAQAQFDLLGATWDAARARDALLALDAQKRTEAQF